MVGRLGDISDTGGGLRLHGKWVVVVVVVVVEVMVVVIEVVGRITRVVQFLPIGCLYLPTTCYSPT